LLLVVHSVHSMDIIPKIDEEKCKRLGRYLAMTESTVGPEERRKRNDFFAQADPANPMIRGILRHKKETIEAINFIARMPDIQFNKLSSEFKTLDKGVAGEVDFLSRRSVFAIFAFHPDVLSFMCSYLPKSYEDHGGFFNSENHEGVICRGGGIQNPGFFLVHPLVDDLEQEENYEEENRRKTESKNKLVMQDEMFGALQDKSICQVLSTFRYVEQKAIETKGRYDNLIIDSSLNKKPGSVHKKGKKYHITYKDLEKMTNEQLLLLRSIVEQSNKGIGYNNIDKRFKITNEHIELLRPLKDFILGNELLRDAQIITDITPPTVLETIKDKSIFFLPRLLVMVAPDLVHSQVNGLLPSAAGLLATSFGSAAFGNYYYPFIDSLNSDVAKLSEWFGRYNHTRINKGLGFFWTGTLHYICTAVAQKLWSWGTTPWRIVGVTIHGARLLASLLILKDDYKRHDNPFERRNKNGVPFTLGDLVSGPKFTEKE